MNNYILAALGAVIFIAALYIHTIKKEQIKVKQISALVAYAGLSMLLIGGLQLLQPVFNSIFGDYGVRVRTVTQVVMFLVGAEFLLKPAFEGELFKDEDKILTPGGIKKKKKDPKKKGKR